MAVHFCALALTREFLEIYSKCPSKLKWKIGDQIKLTHRSREVIHDVMGVGKSAAVVRVGGGGGGGELVKQNNWGVSKRNLLLLLLLWLLLHFPSLCRGPNQH